MFFSFPPCLQVGSLLEDEDFYSEQTTGPRLIQGFCLSTMDIFVQIILCCGELSCTLQGVYQHPWALWHLASSIPYPTPCPVLLVVTVKTLSPGAGRVTELKPQYQQKNCLQVFPNVFSKKKSPSIEKHWIS